MHMHMHMLGADYSIVDSKVYNLGSETTALHHFHWRHVHTV